MTPVFYDGSYEGLLTAIFEIYEYKIVDFNIMPPHQQANSLFAQGHAVATNKEKAQRVFTKLEQVCSPAAIQNIFAVYLSELPDMENGIMRFVSKALKSAAPYENNYSDPDALMIKQVSRKVYRERHRMEAFVRFKRTKDDIYYAIIEPTYNVLPLLVSHFKNRYADQSWLIYDAQRRYAAFYNQQEVAFVEVEHARLLASYHNNTGKDGVHEELEALFQNSWKTYFKSVNIAARKNTKLHVQHMPKRYWKYLVEKQ
jgi:probable DNA metabolism protein